MGAPEWWTLCIGLVALGSVGSSPLPQPRPVYDARLSSLELAIIKCIVETVPGVTKGGGGSYDWSVIQSRSKELQGAEIEVVQVGQRDPDFARRSEEDARSGYPNDWNIVRSVSSHLAAREDGQSDGREGLSNDWAIVRSISTELHLDVEPATGDAYSEPAYEQKGTDGLKISDEVVNQPISSVDDTSGGSSDVPIDIRLKSGDFPSENGKVTHQTYSQSEEYTGMAKESVGTSDYHQSSGNEYDGFAHQSSGELNNARGTIGWSIVRSISSEQDPMIEEISSSEEQRFTSSSESEKEKEKEDEDSYNVVQPISTQPAGNEAVDIPTSLTELSPPSVEQTSSSWNSQATIGAQDYDVHSSGTDTQLAQEPCETGHRRIKDVCRKVYTFQLKSHVR